MKRMMMVVAIAVTGCGGADKLEVENAASTATPATGTVTVDKDGRHWEMILAADGTVTVDGKHVVTMLPNGDAVHAPTGKVIATDVDGALDMVRFNETYDVTATGEVWHREKHELLFALGADGTVTGGPGKPVPPGASFRHTAAPEHRRALARATWMAMLATATIKEGPRPPDVKNGVPVDQPD